MKVVISDKHVETFQRFSNRSNKDESKIQKKFMVLAAAFQTNENPVVVIDTDSGNIIHSVLLDTVYPKIGFKDNLHIDLLGEKLMFHVKGKVPLFTIRHLVFCLFCESCKK